MSRRQDPSTPQPPHPVSRLAVAGVETVLSDRPFRALNRPGFPRRLLQLSQTPAVGASSTRLRWEAQGAAARVGRSRPPEIARDRTGCEGRKRRDLFAACPIRLEPGASASPAPLGYRQGTRLASG